MGSVLNRQFGANEDSTVSLSGPESKGSGGLASSLPKITQNSSTQFVSCS
jgi:hypothetical protein